MSCASGNTAMEQLKAVRTQLDALEKRCARLETALVTMNLVGFHQKSLLSQLKLIVQTLRLSNVRRQEIVEGLGE